MKRSGLAAVAAAIVVITALACGDVPTLPDGIAYISRLALPSPAIEAGDTLRDSTGRVGRIGVPAFDAEGKPIAGLIPVFTVLTLGPSVLISPDGIVTATDSVRPVVIVARLGERLQTTPETLYVVPRPDSLVSAPTAAPPVTDSLTGQSPPLQVTVTGARGGRRVPVRAIVVRYAVTRVFPASRPVDPANFFLLDDNLRARSSNQLALPDTTNDAGMASRVLLVVSPVGIDSVEVRASATDLRARPLAGSPARFIVRVRR